MFKNRLTLLFLFVFVDLLGYSLILPLLPYFADTYGANPTLIGLLAASNGVAQLIGAPIVGRLSDRYGRRPLLIISLAGTVAAFLMLASARSLTMLFVSRIFDGLLGGNMSLAQAYISDITDEKNRSRSLGMIGAAFGLGFIIGPAIGGTLSRGGYALPAFVAAALSGLNLLAVVLLLPESLTPERRAEIARSPHSALTARALWTALNQPRVGPLLHVRLFYSLAFTGFQANFALYAKYHLDLTAQATSYVFTYVGVLVVLVQAVIIGWLTSRFKETHLVVGATALMAVSLLAWAFVPNLALLLIILVPLALAGGVLNTLLNSLLTKAVYPEMVGGTLGLSASFESFTRIAAPSAGGLLIERLGTWAPGLAGALIMAWLVSFAWRRLIRQPDAPLAGRGGPAPMPQETT